MSIDIKKDGDGYIAFVTGSDNLFAFAYTPEEAEKELYNVVDMMMDYHLELVEQEREIKTLLSHRIGQHAL